MSEPKVKDLKKEYASQIKTGHTKTVIEDKYLPGRGQYKIDPEIDAEEDLGKEGMALVDDRDELDEVVEDTKGEKK